jgi:hypothetical protein
VGETIKDITNCQSFGRGKRRKSKEKERKIDVVPKTPK